MEVVQTALRTKIRARIATFASPNFGCFCRLMPAANWPKWWSLTLLPAPSGVQQHAEATNHVQQVVEVQTSLPFSFEVSRCHPITHATCQNLKLATKFLTQGPFFANRNACNSASQDTRVDQSIKGWSGCSCTREALLFWNRFSSEAVNRSHMHSCATQASKVKQTRCTNACSDTKSRLMSPTKLSGRQGFRTTTVFRMAGNGAAYSGVTSHSPGRVNQRFLIWHKQSYRKHKSEQAHAQNRLRLHTTGLRSLRWSDPWAGLLPLCLCAIWILFLSA